MSNNKHYHYLIGYSLITTKNGEFGFGDVQFFSEKPIKSSDIEEIRKKLSKSCGEKDIKVTNIMILSISPLECGCEEENKEND